MVKAVFIAVARDEKFRIDYFQKRITTGTFTTMMEGDLQIAIQSTLPVHRQSEADHSSQNNPLRIRQLAEQRR